MPVQGRDSKPDQQTAIVTFRLGRQIYALPIAPVRQIIEMVTVTPIPQAHKSVMGVINFHGVLAPVMNLGLQLGLAESPVELHTPIILVTLADRLIGLIVDQVLDVLTLPEDQIIAPQSTILQNIGEIAILQGLIFTPEGTILLLNLEHLFSAGYARSLMEAADALASQIENEVSTGGTAQQFEQPDPPEWKLEAVTKIETQPAPVKRAKNHSRKKTGNLQTDSNEAAA